MECFGEVLSKSGSGSALLPVALVFASHRVKGPTMVQAVHFGSKQNGASSINILMFCHLGLPWSINGLSYMSNCVNLARTGVLACFNSVRQVKSHQAGPRGGTGPRSGCNISPWCQGPDQLNLLPLGFTTPHEAFTTPVNVFMAQKCCLFILHAWANQPQSYAYMCGGCWSFSHLLHFLPDALMQSHSWPACIWHRWPEGLKTVSHPVQNTVVAPCFLTYNFLSSLGSMQKKAAHAWTLDRMVSSRLCPHWRGGEHVSYSVLPPWGLCTGTCLKWSCTFVRNPRIALVSPLSNVLAYAVTQKLIFTRVNLG